MVLNKIILLILLGSISAGAADPKAPKTSPPPKKVDETPKADPACGQLEKKDHLEINPRTYFKLIEQGNVRLLSLSVHLCYPVGFRPKLFSSRSENGIFSENIYRGRATVKSIKTIDFNKIIGDSSLGVTSDELKELQLRLSKRQKRRADLGTQVYVIDLEKPEWTTGQKNYGVPLSHPMAENVGAKRIREMLAAKKNNVLDIRTAKLFKKSPLKGAVNISLNIYGDMTSQILTYAEMNAAGVYFPKNLLPKDLAQDVYVLSACALEYSSYNFVTYLKHLGYKKVYWFRGGNLGLKPKSPVMVTPKTIAGVEKIEAGEVSAKLISKSTKLIDVRTHRRKEKFSILNADQTEFIQKYNAMGVPDLREGITLAKLKAKREWFSNELDIKKDQLVIIFGQNEYDWGAYKAAVALASLGFKNVYWYRQGMDDWKTRSIIDSKKFPLTNIVKKEDLYL